MIGEHSMILTHFLTLNLKGVIRVNKYKQSVSSSERLTQKSRNTLIIRMVNLISIFYYSLTGLKRNTEYLGVLYIILTNI